MQTAGALTRLRYWMWGPEKIRWVEEKGWMGRVRGSNWVRFWRRKPFGPIIFLTCEH